MRHASLSLVVACVLLGCATSRPAAPLLEEQLVGTWQVDLRPTPDAAPYYQQLVITSIDGASFTGTFYGAPVFQGRLNNDWGKWRIAFVTEDGSGPYYHSAVLNGDTLEGLSNSSGRDFLSYWSAVKQ
ncbi:MAG: hypothetical protein AAF351_00590 [Pseudomonadota bacterium]